MKILKDYIQSPTTRAEQNKRKERVAKLLGVSTKSLKAMYLYGQGYLKNWDRITAYIIGVDQKIMVKFLKYPLYLEKIKDMPKSKQKLYDNIEKLSQEEISFINRIIDLAIKTNKLGK